MPWKHLDLSPTAAFELTLGNDGIFMINALKLRKFNPKIKYDYSYNSWGVNFARTCDAESPQLPLVIKAITKSKWSVLKPY